MSDLLQSAFSLRHSPFAPDIAAEDLWLDEARKDAIDRVVDAVSRRRHVLVKGEAGTGKNCLLRAMRTRLSPVHFRTVYVVNVTLGRRDFYRQVCAALGIVPKGTPAALFEAIQRDVEAQHREHRIHPVLVLDEAHLMPDSTLGHLHVLANFDWDSQPLLSLVLVGLPELHDRLRLGIHRALLTRLSVCVEVAPRRSRADRRLHPPPPRVGRGQGRAVRPRCARAAARADRRFAAQRRCPRRRRAARRRPARCEPVVDVR